MPHDVAGHLAVKLQLDDLIDPLRPGMPVELFDDHARSAMLFNCQSGICIKHKTRSHIKFQLLKSFLQRSYAKNPRSTQASRGRP